MYLTDKKNGNAREIDDHEELEFLLESFSKQVEEIVSEVGNIDVSFRHVVGASILYCHSLLSFRQTWSLPKKLLN